MGQYGEGLRGPLSQVSWNLICCYDDYYCCKDSERTFKRNPRKKERGREREKGGGGRSCVHSRLIMKEKVGGYKKPEVWEDTAKWSGLLHT